MTLVARRLVTRKQELLDEPSEASEDLTVAAQGTAQMKQNAFSENPGKGDHPHNGDRRTHRLRQETSMRRSLIRRLDEAAQFKVSVAFDGIPFFIERIGVPANG